MALRILSDDALTVGPDGWQLRVCLPWIRSLPLWSLHSVSVDVDGDPAAAVVRLGERDLEPAGLRGETGWWFVQDRLLLVGRRSLGEGRHEIRVAFELAIPYLPGGADQPLTIEFSERRVLEANAARQSPAVWRDVA